MDNLTEQWKKGTLEKKRRYWIKNINFNNIIPAVLLASGNFDAGFNYYEPHKNAPIEVLGPCNYSELEDLRKENARIKEENAALYKKWQDEEHVSVFQKERLAHYRAVLQDCKQLFIAELSFLIQCTRADDLNAIIARIEDLLEDKQ